MRVMAILGIISFLLWSGLATAQFKDSDFKAPSDMSGTFDEKAVLIAPPGPPVIKKGAPLWSNQAELGLNGNEGNSEAVCLRLGANSIRQTEGNIFTSDFVYSFKRQKSVVAENKALYNIRDEAYFTDSAWGMFAAGQVEYDQFRDYDFRVAGHGGYAYQFLKNDSTSLRGRFGAGASREIGGPKDRWIPEGLLGVDVFHSFDSRQRVVFIFDYYPDVAMPAHYRIRSRLAYEIAIDPACRFRIRIGLQDRYDSQPGHAKPNDLDYFTSLLVKF